MSITFSGLATGLDTDSIVTDLMAVERAPIDRLVAKKTSATERLEAYAQFNSLLDELKTAVGDMALTSQVRSTQTSLSSEAYFSASSNSGATGSYDISVLQLSQVQKNITGGFSSNSESILGTGTITVNGTEIAVTEENNSLLGLVESINAVSDTTGVQATIINDGSGANPYHLVFTGEDSATSFEIESTLQISTPGDVDMSTTQVRAAQQAVAIIDGITVVSDTNTISSAISGVTLNLNSVNSTSYAGTAEEGVDPWEWSDPPVYETTRMDVGADTDALKEKITSFVTAYNSIMEWIVSGYEETAATTKTAEDGEEETMLGSVLRGDATINSVKRQLQSVLTNSINNSGGFQILSEIGIFTNRDGTLTQNNTRLDAALETNFEDMVYLLAGDDDTAGVMKGFNSLLLDVTSNIDGMYAVQKSSYDSAIDKYDSQIDIMEERLSKRELTLRNQFNAMEQLISTLNAQGDFLTQQINALSGDK
jgi:flagellar hook-associated protein 2